MSSLARIQRRFQQYVLAGDRTILQHIASCGSISAGARVGVYADSYVQRLTDALATNFPCLREQLGAEEFTNLARTYIASHPSSYRSIRWFGHALPACIELSHAEAPWLADLAEWEWSLALAFDAPDATPIAEQAVAAIAPEHWPRLRFDFHPSVQLIALESNAPALFRAFSEESPCPAPDLLADEQHWLIWREDVTTRYRSLDEAERAPLEAARAGAPFAQICSAVAAGCGAEEAPLQAAMLLKRWIADGLVTGVRDYLEAAVGG